jgi:glycosyltransferase involved in cell wall biosynthesis
LPLVKIALCIEYPIAQHGGTEVLVKELVHGLSARHSIILVSPDDAQSIARSGLEGNLQRHIPWQTEPATIARGQELAARLKQAAPDIVHFHFGGNYAWKNRAFSCCPVVSVRRAGLRVISTNHGAFSIFEGYCWEQRPFWIKLALLPPAWLSKQYVLRSLATEVAVSQNDYHALRRWYAPSRHKFRWIYHSRIRDDQPPAPNLNRQKAIVCAGTIGPRKGQTFLAEAFCRIAHRFPDWQLHLIGREGDADMARQIRELIGRHQLEGQIKMHGPCTDQELRDWLKSSAIFAMPSLYEGLGLSLQEAQFYGCACVGTRCGGVTDLIQNDDNGLLVDAGQVEPLAKALERLISDTTLRERLSRRAPQSVLEKGMTAGKMVEAYERLYGELLNRRA